MTETSDCSGEQYDPDLGLYYLRARYYNSLTGRFISRDPVGGQMADPKTLHKYLYASGDPVNAKDPTGRSALLEGVYLDIRSELTVTEVAKGLWYALVRACYLEIGYDLYNLVVNHETPKPLAAVCDIIGLANPPGGGQ
jgi:RHS repeat-associated protein